MQLTLGYRLLPSSCPNPANCAASVNHLASPRAGGPAPIRLTSIALLIKFLKFQQVEIFRALPCPAANRAASERLTAHFVNICRSVHLSAEEGRNVELILFRGIMSRDLPPERIQALRRSLFRIFRDWILRA